eukprot:gnl/Chilomastix_caulleri/6559.p2 GENE.gnl/Chilomastix_caulleri/6559~~gnl/Chilomastix_caulleri/6559.p2  ORF type:complete len:56 (+),score=14.16 gnl/Chilomastix_caulleri/6559:228-395(+)
MGFNGQKAAGATVSPNQLSDVVRNHLSEHHPDQMGQLERILEIFVQMFNDDEIQQ